MGIMNFLYSIYDRKASYYLPPFAARSDTEAERTFIEAVTRSETPVSLYPADFDLVRLGAIDLESGVLSSNNSGMPVLMVNGLTCLQAAHADRKRYQSALAPFGAESEQNQLVNGEAHA